MHARVARFENADADGQRGLAEMIKESEGPPEGLPASGILVLADADEGATIVVTLFDNEDDLRTGHEHLSSRDPDPDASPGTRASVNLCEVLVKREKPGGAGEV